MTHNPTAWVEKVNGEFEFTDHFAKATEIMGMEIVDISIGGDSVERLLISFTNGRSLGIMDTGQSCCESRYMTCDDDLSGHAGGYLLSIDLAAGGGDVDDTYECHETQFVKVQTTKGSFTLVTHNAHNGYYGGFSLEAHLYPQP
jgi:hypothetical protein